MRRLLFALAMIIVWSAGVLARPQEAGGTPALLTVNQYIAALEQLTPQNARALIGTQIDSPNGRFAADDALLEAVARGDKTAPPRVAATIAALRRIAPSGVGVVDPKRIEQLRRSEAADELTRGGEIKTAPQGNDPMFVRMVEALVDGLRWIWHKLVEFAEWLDKWWPHTGSSRVKGSSTEGMPFLVFAIVVLIVIILGILAIEVMRRSKRGEAEPVLTSDPISSRRDEDPLSRGANEWERYAAQLAAAGRIREAIRAWYHAVLVTLYGAGILHFRKGRTNWEYVSSVTPDVAWRPELVRFTRRFEEEWYGHERSSTDALDECSGLARQILGAVRRKAAA